MIECEEMLIKIVSGRSEVEGRYGKGIIKKKRQGKRSG